MIKIVANLTKYLDNGKKIKDAFKASQMLSEESAMPVPEQITELQNKEKRFTKVIDRTETVESVFDFVKKNDERRKRTRQDRRQKGRG